MNKLRVGEHDTIKLFRGESRRHKKQRGSRELLSFLGEKGGRDWSENILSKNVPWQKISQQEIKYLFWVDF